MTRSRARVVACLLCAGTAFLVWNGIFGLMVSRGEKQYLLDQTRHELGLGPLASLPSRMDGTIANGAREATRWAVVVFVLGVAAVWVSGRGQREEPEEEAPSDALLDD